MDIDAKLKQRLNVFEEIDKLANKNLPIKNNVIIKTYNQSLGRTSPFLKEIASSVQYSKLKKTSKEKKTDKSSISNYDQNILAHNYSQISNLQSPFKDSVSSFLDYNEDSKAQKICDRSLFSPVNEMISTYELSNNGNNITCKSSKINFSNRNFVNNININNYQKNVCLGNINKNNYFNNRSKSKSSNSKSRSKESKGVYCKENPRNYTPDSCSGDDSKSNRSNNKNKTENIKNKKNNSSKQKLNKTKSFDKITKIENYNNPNCTNKIDENKQFYHMNPVQNMHIINLEDQRLNGNLNNLKKENFSSGINSSPDPIINTNLKRNKSSETLKSNFISSKKPNKVYQDLYNFQDQFMFSDFKQENIDSFYSLKQKYNPKSNKNVKDENWNSLNNQKKLGSKSFYKSYSAANFNSQHKEEKEKSGLQKSNAHSKDHFEKLYNDRYVLENKILQKKISNEKTFLQNSKPEITKKAKKIVRDPNLFHCRLYPYHKIDDSLTHISGFSHKSRHFYEEFDGSTGRNKKVNRSYSGSNIYYDKNINNKRDYTKNQIYDADNFQSLKSEINDYKNKQNNDLVKNEEGDDLNNTFTGVYCNIIENIKKLEGIDDIKSFKIYRTSKNKRKGLYDEYEKSKGFESNIDNIVDYEGKKFNLKKPVNKDEDPFTFSPLLNKKSMLIASKLEDSKTRLLKSSRKNSPSPFNINSKVGVIQNDKNKFTFESNNNYNFFNNIRNPNEKITNDVNRIYSNSFDNNNNENSDFNSKENNFHPSSNNNQEFYSSSPQINLNTKNHSNLNYNRAKKHINNFSYNNINIKQIKNCNFVTINNIKIPTRPLLLYDRGLKSIKRKQAKSYEKQLKDAQLWKTFSYKPQINRRLSPQIYRGKAIKLGQSESKRNLSESSVNNLNNDLNAETIANDTYEKHLIWKNNVERKTKKIKAEKEMSENKECTYKPEIIKSEMPNDEKFIERNLNQIQDYVNRRRAFIQKTKEDEKYKEKRLNLNINLKKFIIKPTIPKEFNITKVNNKEHSKDHSINFENSRFRKLNNDEKSEEKLIDKNSSYVRDGNFDRIISESILGNNSDSRSPFKVERVGFHSIEKFRKQFKTQEYFEKNDNDRNNNIRNDKGNMSDSNKHFNFHNYDLDNNELVLGAASNHFNVINQNDNNFRRNNNNQNNLKIINFTNFRNISSHEENEFLYGEANPHHNSVDNNAQYDMLPYNPDRYDISYKDNSDNNYNQSNNNNSISGKNLTFSPHNQNNMVDFTAIENNFLSPYKVNSSEFTYNNQYLENNLINNQYTESTRIYSHSNAISKDNLSNYAFANNNFYSEKNLTPNDLNYIHSFRDDNAQSNLTNKKNSKNFNSYNNSHYKEEKKTNFSINKYKINYDIENEKLLNSNNHHLNNNKINTINPLIKKPNIKIFNLLNAEAMYPNKNNTIDPNSSKNIKKMNLTRKQQKENSNRNNCKSLNNTSDKTFAQTENYTNRGHFENDNFEPDSSNLYRNPNENIGYPIDQQKFIDAVKSIHDRLVNTNI